MSPRETFLTAAVRATGGNIELRQQVWSHLDEQTTALGEDELQAAMARLEAGRIAKSDRRGWLFAAVVMVVAAIACCLINARQFFIYRAEVAVNFAYLSGSMPTPNRDAISGLSSPTRSQRLLLFGDPGRADQADQFRGLTESDPNNPVFYSIFAKQFLRRGNLPPPDFVERVEATDPGNGFLYFVAAGCGSSTVKKTGGGFEIIDRPRFDQFMDWFHRAAAAPTLHDFHEEESLARMEVMPKASDYLTNYAVETFQLGQSITTEENLFGIAKMLAAEAQDEDMTNDAASFKKLSAEWRSVCTKLLDGSDQSIIDLLFKQAAIKIVAKAFADSATRLHLGDESAYYTGIVDGIDRIRSEAAESRRQTEASVSPTAKDAVLLPVPFHVPAIPSTDFVPGRLTMHALFQRITLFAAGLVLAGATGMAAAYRFRGAALSRALARILFRLRWRKCLPLCVVAAITPLILCQIVLWAHGGPTRWDVFWGGLLLTQLQWAAALELCVLLPLYLARHSLARERVASLPASRWGHRVAIACLACCLVAWALPFVIPSFDGFNEIFTHDHGLLAGVGPIHLDGACGTAFYIACGLVILPLLYLVFTGIRAVCSSRQRLPRRLATAKLLLPSYLAGFVVLGFLQPVLHGVESYWFLRDPLNGLDPAHPSVGREEALVIEPAYQRLRQVLSEAEQAR